MLGKGLSSTETVIKGHRFSNIARAPRSAWKSAYGAMPSGPRAARAARHTSQPACLAPAVPVWLQLYRPFPEPGLPEVLQVPKSFVGCISSFSGPGRWAALTLMGCMGMRVTKNLTPLTNTHLIAHSMQDRSAKTEAARWGRRHKCLLLLCAAIFCVPQSLQRCSAARVADALGLAGSGVVGEEL